MEVVFGVLFLPCPLDLNGTKFSCKDERRREERRGGAALAGSWLLISALEVQVQIRLQESFSSVFSLYTMKLLCVQKLDDGSRISRAQAWYSELDTILISCKRGVPLTCMPLSFLSS